MRQSLDSQLESTRLSVDSKIASVLLELDRMHKLLQIRPTNSEFQQVCVCVRVCYVDVCVSGSEYECVLVCYMRVCVLVNMFLVIAPSFISPSN